MANLDPSIILGVKPLNLAQPDPLERYVKLAGVQEITGKLADQERARADEQAVREAYQQSGGDTATLRKLLTGKGAYKQVQALDKADYERRQAESTITRNTAQAGKAEWEVRKEQAQNGASLIGTATPQTWEQVVRFGTLNKFWSPEAGEHLLQQGYSPQLVQQVQRSGITYVQQLEEQNRVAVRGETGRHNLATETTARGQLGVAQGNLAETRRHHGVTEGNDAVQYLVTPEGVIAVPKRPGAGQAPTGQFVVDPSGKPLAGKGSDKPLNDSQSKALLYSNRMTEADQIINDLSVKGTNVGIPGIGSSGAINAISPEAQQSLIQAKRNFINAVLRRESGAVISPSEMAEADKQYFPQVGEGANIVKQKAANRRTAIAGIQAEVPQQHRPTAAAPTGTVPSGTPAGAAGWSIKPVP